MELAADRTLTLGVMQPYLFPYLGYFQLIAAVDRFVVYDDVSFMKQGWVNRNRILVNGAPHMFTLPLSDAGSFTAINAIGTDPRRYDAWSVKFLRTVSQAYSRAPNLRPVQDMLERVLHGPHERLVDLLVNGIREVMAYIGSRTELVPSSSVHANLHLSGQARILDICGREGADRYVNAIGGKELYNAAAFAERGIMLSFLRSRLPPYQQGRHAWVPGLSILDILLYVPQEELPGMMNAYDLE